MLKTIKNNKGIFILFAVALVMPSIYYILSGNIINADANFSLFYIPYSSSNSSIRVISACLFVIIFGGLGYLYGNILKKSVEYFKDAKAMFIYIMIISILFTICLPMTAADIYYYIGTGHIEIEYGENPFYTTIEDVINNLDSEDEILEKTPKIWRNATVVYGPLWAYICKVLVMLSNKKLVQALIAFKIFNLILHIANTAIIYRLTNKKKVFTLMYGINPFVLFAALTNVHNDIVTVFFTLIAIYFLKKKKNIVISVIALALATAVKYYTIILVPFFILYYFRDKKILKKLLCSTILMILFFGIVALMYLGYVKDISIFKSSLIQQKKVCNSIYLILTTNLNYELAIILSKFVLVAFALVYIKKMVELLLKKDFSFFGIAKEYENFILAFLFLIITGFQSWYIIWLFPFLIYQRGSRIKFVLKLSIIAELSNFIYFLFDESYSFGYIYITIILAFIAYSFSVKINKRKNRIV